MSEKECKHHFIRWEKQFSENSEYHEVFLSVICHRKIKQKLFSAANTINSKTSSRKHHPRSMLESQTKCTFQLTSKSVWSVFSLGIYLTFVMAMTTVSVIMTVIVLNFFYRGPNLTEVPPWAKRLVLLSNTIADPTIWSWYQPFFILLEICFMFVKIFLFS